MAQDHALKSTADERHAGAPAPFASVVAVVLSAAWVLAATVIQVLRQPGVPAYDTLWAEDGQIFLWDALERSPLSAMTRPLAGYLHFLPRLIGEVAAALPLEAAAQVFSVGPALVVALLSLYIFHGSRAVLPATWARVVLTGMYVLLPATATESANTAANLHFYLFLPAFVALVDRPATLRRAIPAIVVVLVSTMSDPRLGLLVPVAALVLWKGAAIGHRAVSLAFFVGLAIQGVVVLYSTTLGPDVLPHYPAHFTVHYGDSFLSDVPRLFGLRVLGPLLVGERLLDDVWESFGWRFSLLSLGVLAVIAAVGFLTRKAWQDRAWLATTLGFAVVFFAVHALAWGTRQFWPFQPFFLAANRYVQTPMLFVIASLLVVLGGRAPQSSTLVRGCRIGFVVLLGVLVLFNYRPTVWRSSGPSWAQQLDAAKAQCAAQPDGDVRIPIAPMITGPDAWYVPATCGAVTGRR